MSTESGNTIKYDPERWKKTVLWTKQYSSAEDICETRESVSTSPETSCVSDTDGPLLINMAQGTGKVTDAGYDQFACCYTAVPADYDAKITAKIRVDAFLESGSSNHQEAWGIFIRDTMEPDPLTGSHYSNMAAAGGYYGTVNLFGRVGIGADDDIEDTGNFYLCGKQSDDMLLCIQNDAPKTYIITIAKEGGCILADITDENGAPLLLPDGSGKGKFITREEGGYIMCVRTDMFLRRDTDNYYLGFMAARGSSISVDTDSIEITTRKTVLPAKNTIFAAPYGSCSGDGSPERPFDLQTAVIQHKDITAMPGTYDMTEDLVIEREQSGDAERRLSLRCNEGDAVLDFHGSGHAFKLEADYWDIERMTVTGGMGIQIQGSHNILRHCIAHHNLETGIIIRHEDNAAPRAEWPKHNLIEDCVSYCNVDPSENNADGFACKVAAGEGNSFVRCLSCLNSDDGFDLFSKNRKTGAVEITDCEAVLNGYKLCRDGSITKAGGNGNGFKLGGSGMSVAHKLTGCSSFDNRKYGFTSNSNPVMHLYDCRAAANGKEDYRYYFTGPGASPDKVIENCVTDDEYERQEWLRAHEEIVRHE